MIDQAWRALIAAVILIPASLSPAKAQAGPDAVGFYKSLEADGRIEFNRLVANANAEKEKRVRAGKVIVTPTNERAAMSAMRMMMYNKLASIGVCADRFTGERDISRAGQAIAKCAEERNQEAVKWYKLTDYIETVGESKMTRCEMKARDFKNEVRFPAFDFLIDDRNPPLFDFRIMNECIMSGM
ncbi:hypothetical protein AB7828_10135 [Tardiphaga sp. 215_C5_N2_1]|uniref:hypothetical protein n=1 Tax=Tardiphaga sp. 215_C5_N2_1 TaxID=3240774 RepID=UPI003F8B9831